MAEIISSPVIPCDHCGHLVNQCEYRNSLPPSISMALRTGQQICSSSEAANYSRAMFAMHSQLTIWDSNMERLEAALDALKTDHRNLSRYASSYQTMLAPVRRLPVEILLSIFEEACSELGVISLQDKIPLWSTEDESVSLYCNTPVYLASVCYYWRSICLSAPKLWTHSYIYARRPSLSSATVNLILLFKKRSNPLPLSISISALYDTEFDCDFSCEHKDAKPLDFDSLNQLLGFGELENTLVDTERLRRLCLDVECRHICDYPPLSFPRLEQLEISGYPSEYSGKGTRLFEDTFNYSKLRELRLSHYYSHKDIHLPWKQIKILQLCNMDSIKILAVFSGVKRVTLSRCGLRGSGGRRELTSPTILTLKECSGPFNLTDSFLFPNISSLELVDTDEFTYPEPMVSRFGDIHCLASGMPSLRDVSLNNVHLLSDTQAILLLNKLPYLTRLSIIERKALNVSDPRVITTSLLKYLREESTLLELESIKLVWRADHPIEESMVMATLEARSGLKEIVIGIREGEDLSKNTLVRMNMLRQRGIAAWLW